MPKDIEDAQPIIIDKRTLLGFRVVTFPTEHQLLSIDHAIGYENDSGVFEPTKRETPVEVQGEALQAIMATKLADLISTSGNPEVTLHEALKTMLYDLLP